MKNHRYEALRGASPDRREQGSALIVVLIVVIMCMLLSVVVAGISHSRSQAAMQGRFRMEALAGAEAALMLKLDEFNMSPGNNRDLNQRTYALANGVTAVADAVDLGANGADDDGDGNVDSGLEVGVFRITSAATSNGETRAIEIHLMTEIHPLFFKAIYAGNKYKRNYTLNLGPGNGSPQGGGNRNKTTMAGNNFKTSSKSQNSDYVEGDVHVNGNVHVTGKTEITGDVDVTGGYTGNNPAGTATAGVDRMEPPSLSAMNYRAMSREEGSWFIESCSNFFDKSSTPLGEWVYSASGKHTKHGPTPTESGYPEEETNPAYGGKYDKGGSFPGGDTSKWDNYPNTPGQAQVDEHPPSFISYGPFTDNQNNGDGKHDFYDAAKAASNGIDKPGNAYFWQDNFSRFTNGNFHFGYGANGNAGPDMVPGTADDGGDSIDFSSVAGPDGLYNTADDITFYYIRGNLWLDTRGQLDFYFPTMPAGQKMPPITIVIEGNLYIGDGMEYTNPDDAVMFIVKQSDWQGQNFMDEDRNGLFDFTDTNGNGLPDGDEVVNEPYVLAGPDGIYGNADDIVVPAGVTPDSQGVDPYRGPMEGQGNVYFGDLKAEQGGTTSGFIFAENNVYMVANNPDIYGVEGFLNAGGTINMGSRQGGANYVEYRVRYDNRIETGAIKFKGLPKNQGADGEDKLARVSWREIPPN